MNHNPAPYEQLGRQLLKVLVVASLVATLVTVGLALADLLVLAAVIGTGTAALYLLVIVVAASVISSHRTVRIMKEGAAIALQAQEFNDKWDTQKAKVFGQVFQQGARSVQALPANSRALPGSPPLPLPSQDTSWMPALTATTLDVEPPFEGEEGEFTFEG
jgi:hypothetical protein